MSRGAPQFSRRRTVAFSIVLTVLGLMVLDWGASYLAYPHPRIRTLPRQQYFEFDPLQMWRLRPGYHDDRIRISKDGFRAEASLTPEPRRTRIFLIGGSTVFGLGVREDETVAHFLQQLLEVASPGSYEVVNAGVTGYYSTQELILTLRKLVGFHPARIIGLTGRNDVFYSLHPRYRVDLVPYHGLLRSQLGALDPYYTPGEGGEPRIHLLRLFTRGWAAVRPEWDREWRATDLAADPRAVPNFIRNERALHALLSGLGIRYDLFLQPTVTLPERALTPAEKRARAASYVTPLTEGYERLRADAARELPAEWAHGLVPLPPSRDPLFLDDCHFTELGAREVARRIGERLFGPIGVERMDFRAGAPAVFLDDGWNAQEKGFRWTRGRARAVLRLPEGPATFRLQGAAGAVDSPLNVSLDGTTVLERSLKAGETLDLKAPVPAGLRGRAVEVTIRSEPWVPREHGMGQDPRQLGIQVRSFGVASGDGS